jgi:hemoglobin/transferrin/lactoferrin receptor protein
VHEQANGKKKKKHFIHGEDNLQYAPVNGMPAWETYNVKLVFSVSQCYHICGVENIFR